LGVASVVLAQGGAAAPQKPAGQAPAAPAPGGTPLQLRSLDSVTQADPFPTINPKNFTADAPSVLTVDSYLRAMIGYDPNRIWRVMAIQKTPAAGVSKVSALITEKGPNQKMLSATFYVLPDGKHLIAPDSSGLNNFGATPFADNRALLQARADGPYQGAASKDLMLVEFSDLQCPHCKDAQAVMAKLVADYPKARIVYQAFPLVDIHPFAFQAAAYGACVAKQNSAAFFTFSQAVYDTQDGLTAEKGVDTLNAAVTKAGADPGAIAACAATDAIKAQVEASSKLAVDLGVNETPTLAVNGRLIPFAQIPYATLKTLINYQAEMDGVAAAAVGPPGSLLLK
jgi:protein-disulfide isomerase